MKKENDKKIIEVIDKKRVIKDIIMIIAGVVMLVAFIYLGKEEPKVPTDAENFASEYTTVGEDNVFVYKTAKEVINILKGGTGVVYMGFPECKWCQAYVKILNEAAKEVGLEEIYYLNILNDRKDNTSEYQEIITLLDSHLQKDDDGNSRVYVPDISIVKEGVMVGHDYETSLDTGGKTDPSEYWNNENTLALKNKLKDLMAKVLVESCTDCNE